MSQTVKAEKVDGKNRVIYLVSILLSRVMVLKLSKKCPFSNLILISVRTLKSIKAIYIYASERSCFALLGNGIV